MIDSANYPFLTSKPAVKSIIEKGLDKYETGLEKNFITYLHIIIPKKINTIVKDQQDSYWIGTENGIYKSDRNLISIDSFPIERTKFIALKDKTTDIKVDKDGNVSSGPNLRINSHQW